MDEAEWRQNARGCNGHLVVWIDQGTDVGLQAVNSRGVCHALTTAWVTAFSNYRVDRAAFVNSFRGGGANTRIPATYLAQQGLYRQRVQANALRFQNAFADLQRRIQRGENVDAVGLRDAMLSARQSYYGPACEALDQYPNEIGANMAIFGGHIDPGFKLLSMHRPVSHVVGFELRPDIVGIPGFPNGLFEYFDANLGLFVFPSANDLSNFWTLAYASLYSASDRVEVASYGIGRGGFVKTWGELLSEVWEWIVAQWNALWGHNPALAALDAMVASARVVRQEAP